MSAPHRPRAWTMSHRTWQEGSCLEDEKTPKNPFSQATPRSFCRRRPPATPATTALCAWSRVQRPKKTKLEHVDDLVVDVLDDHAMGPSPACPPWTWETVSRLTTAPWAKIMVAVHIPQGAARWVGKYLE